MNNTKPFFVAGGTLRPDVPSYVKRPADDDLFEAALAKDFCYVLTARQMGKSSLMTKTARRLQEQSIHTAIIDLTAIGTGEITIDQWYMGLITHLKDQLRLPVATASWWNEHTSLSTVQRFIKFLRDVVLEHIEGTVVVFIDEIDATLSLDFADDFFAAIRSIYNARAADSAYERLTFALFGVATPSDLIKDRSRTPFNIGHGINLTEFTTQDAALLLTGLQQTYPEYAGRIFDRVFYWTNGHPYLTQKLFMTLVNNSGKECSEQTVDDTVNKLFFSEEASKEVNLQYVRDSVETASHKEKLMRLYQKIYNGQKILEDERSIEQNRLKLFGLVRAKNGVLQVRNEIYRRVFNQNWIKGNIPVDWTRRIAVISTALLLVLVAAFGVSLYRQSQITADAQAQVLIDSFHSTTSAEVRITSLAGLCKLNRTEQAQRLFFDDLSPAEQISLFNLQNPQDVGDNLIIVVKGLYSLLSDNDSNNALLKAVVQTLRKFESNNPTALNLATEIEEWLIGRQYAKDGNWEQAVAEYDVAIRLNQHNSGTYFDRAIAYMMLKDYENTLNDLNIVITLTSSQKAAVQQIINQSDGLFTYLGMHRELYPAIAEAFPTLTPTSTATPPEKYTPTPTRPSPKTEIATLTNTVAPTPTPDTPTPTHKSTRVPTPTPLLETIFLQSPQQGRSYKPPVTFNWSGSLKSNQEFQITVRHQETGKTIQSEPLESNSWSNDLPRTLYGQWFWKVAIIENGKTILTSAENFFWLDPNFGDSPLPKPTAP